MKRTYLVYPLFALTVAVSCGENKTSDPPHDKAETTEIQSENIDPISLSFFKQDIFDGGMEGKNVVYFLYPGFCGACNDTVVEFIKTNSLPNFEKRYVFSENDSVLIKQFSNLGGMVSVFEPDYLMEHGLYKATNHLYLFDDTLLLYESSINAENIEDVRLETSRF